MRKHLTYSNVVATLALVLVVAGGTAIAVERNSVTSASIKPNNVTAKDLTGVRVVQANGIFKAFAPCAKGEKLLGGGGSVSGDTGPVGASRPGGNGWFVNQALVSGGGANSPVIAYALCLRAKPKK